MGCVTTQQIAIPVLVSDCQLQPRNVDLAIMPVTNNFTGDVYLLTSFKFWQQLYQFHKNSQNLLRNHCFT